ncbi:sensor histidine kinase [Roseibium sp.]|uniref:sensor histidine kinase n=1 Tax=Roseibium sp. TaxID=1936156 RepID=UPI003A96994E
MSMVSLKDQLATVSLKTRVAVGVTLLLLIGGVVVSLAAFAYGRQAAQDAYDRLLLGAANDIAESIQIQNGAPRVQLPISAFELLALAPDDRIGYRVIGVDGATLTGYDEVVPPEGKRLLSQGFFDAAFFGEPARFVVVSRRFAERTLNGTIRVVVGHTLLARNALAFDITRKALYVLGLSGIAMLLLAALVVRSALKPLERIADGLTRRDPNDLTPMDTKVPPELAVMVTAVNRFMGRLDRQMTSMRQLISDTAHQLRTPVAALRAQADVLIDEQDAERRHRIVELIQMRSENLGRLLDQLLSRALVSHRVDSAKREIVDLRDIALDVYEAGDHQILLPDADIRLEIPEGPVLVLADAPSLQEALKNLLSNALKYGVPPVVLGVSRDEGLACLWVEDAGQGPDATVLRRLGERFNVRDGSAASGSSGLGLAIASAVAEAFSGKLEMKQMANGRFQTSLDFVSVQEAVQ